MCLYRLIVETDDDDDDDDSDDNLTKWHISAKSM
jgi:hypothetical protein